MLRRALQRFFMDSIFDTQVIQSGYLWLLRHNVLFLILNAELSF